MVGVAVVQQVAVTYHKHTLDSVEALDKRLQASQGTKDSVGSESGGW